MISFLAVAGKSSETPTAPRLRKYDRNSTPSRCSRERVRAGWNARGLCRSKSREANQRAFQPARSLFAREPRRGQIPVIFPEPGGGRGFTRFALDSKEGNHDGANKSKSRSRLLRRAAPRRRPDSPSAARRRRLIVAQNHGSARAGQGQGEPNPKEHKKDHGDRREQPPVPQAQPPHRSNPSNARRPGPDPDPGLRAASRMHTARGTAARGAAPNSSSLCSKRSAADIPQRKRYSSRNFSGGTRRRNNTTAAADAAGHTAAAAGAARSYRSSNAPSLPRGHRPREDGGTPAVAPNTPPAGPSRLPSTRSRQRFWPRSLGGRGAPTQFRTPASSAGHGQGGHRAPGQAGGSAVGNRARPSLAPKVTPGFAPGGPTAQREPGLAGRNKRSTAEPAGGAEGPRDCARSNRVFVRNGEKGAGSRRVGRTSARSAGPTAPPRSCGRAACKP